MKKHEILTAIVIVVMLVLVAIMTVFLFPILRAIIENTRDESVMVQFIYSYGFQGVPVLLGMLILQVVVPFIPSVAIQVLTGLCYGVWLGVLINIIGITLGNMLVFFALRQSGSLIAPFFKKGRARQGTFSLANLSRLKAPERVVFFCFLIPGFPNGFAPYLFSRTKISFHKYILAVIAGSIPQTFIATLLGDRLSQGNHDVAIVIAIVIVLIVIAALIFKKRLLAFIIPLEEINS